MDERFRYSAISYHRVSVSPPVSHAVTLSEVRTRLRLSTEDVDADIQMMIGEAEAWWESATGCHLMPQESELRLDRFPTHDSVLPLMYQPIRSVASVKYWEPASPSMEQTWDAENYQAELDTRGGRLRARAPWPSVEANRLDAVSIRMSTGYDPTATTPIRVPDDVKGAILLYVGARYRWREELDGRKPLPIPMGAQSIAARHRLSWLPMEVK